MDKCKKVFKPTPDETDLPCDVFNMTDCVYLSDTVNAAYLDLAPTCNMTELINALIKRIYDQDKEIDELRQLINNIS